MIGFGSQHRIIATLLITAALATLGAPAQAKDEKHELPVCPEKIGTMSIVEPENKWWTQYNLESPRR